MAGCRPRPQPVAPDAAFAPSSRAAFEQAAAATVPVRHEILRIGWHSDDGHLELTGNGAVRIAPPDSLRLDIAASLGLGRTVVLMMGERVASAPAAAIDQLLPDRFALWAALGIMRSPPGPLNYEVAEQGPAAFWRTTDALGRSTVYELRGWALASVTRLENGRAVSQLRLSRTGTGELRRANLLDTARGFRLQVDINGRETSEPFDPTIWRLRA